ncbi:MAG: bifunctional (p)ppGpp synthetase/guanosine-3',5'-bis(diphosphate) 3'-pyrophosphohydrolase [Candidatus Hydrogenedentes bacterium]|jgi:guanosine-3',5'-bis(diphosphate) 3'-pyrophosphohydrolase|nr:bifunctional (p)ppGpp synthetase/guanosine-3',5'-bis(diphosphate) 3'-pyrophosphohydrolase [Candidatus Hydrogenedentota bacterium]
MSQTLVTLMRELKKHYDPEDLGLVRHAFRVANEAHQDQLRASGEPYISHSLGVATILAELGLDPVTCAAALLHDVVEDTIHKIPIILQEFGDEIAWIVEGVTKISGLRFLNDDKEREEQQAQNIRKMLVATAKDLRVIMIKLADRLHNMRTLSHLKIEDQKRIARETLDIYAPLANRLGISRWKWELEDHSFRVLMPEIYRKISKLVAMKRNDREEFLENTIAYLEPRLKESEVAARVIGRPKHLYSIYEKMTHQGKDFSQVMDVLAIRIITQTEAGCYNALGVVHGVWTPIPGRLKDYIAMPKLNMYQAIHTTVMRENGFPMEVQIRSENMDYIAREGVAAHWRYKEGDSRQQDKLGSQLAWLQKMYEWLKDVGSHENLMDSMRMDFSSANIYVFTPRGEVKELPQGATPLDFAYLVHSYIGHHCIGARVNGKMVSLRYNLQMGDSVEILTSKNQEPHLDWIDVVVTGRARTRIRQRLRELGEMAPAEEQKVGVRTRHVRGSRRTMPTAEVVREVDEASRQKLIRVEGLKGMLVQFAKCCNPMPGHAIIGYVTRTPGISIHRVECKSFARSARDHTRVVHACWDGESHMLAKIRLITRNRPNLLADITNALRPLNIDILNAHFGPGENENNYFDFQFEATNEENIEKAAQAVLAVPGVFNSIHLGVQDPCDRKIPKNAKKNRAKELKETG